MSGSVVAFLRCAFFSARHRCSVDGRGVDSYVATCTKQDM